MHVLSFAWNMLFYNIRAETSSTKTLLSGDPLRSAFLLLVLCLTLPGQPGRAAPLRVAADILPVHSLVSMVIDGTDTQAALLLPAAAGGAATGLSTEKEAALEEADLLVWIGPPLTPDLARMKARLAPRAAQLTLLALPGTERLQIRGARAARGLHDLSRGHEHSRLDGVDPYAWLSPYNAGYWIAEITLALTELDPENAPAYRANAARATLAIESLAQALAADLGALPSRVFVASPDAFQYFEAAFGLRAYGAIAPSGVRLPGAPELARLRAEFKARGVACLVARPGFDTARARAIAPPEDLALAEADPFGRALPPGKSHYPALLLDLADIFRQCL